MKAVIQRVKSASVTIDNELYSSIGQGLLVLYGVEKGDVEENSRYLCDKILKLRIFEDENGKMNLSVKDVQGEILVVSQFTLAGDTRKGTRPSFDTAMPPKEANEMYENFVSMMKESGLTVKTGVFGAMMDVALVNDGPVTFILNSPNK
ncbi:MAG: D-tyrosyl-tRNA(Tyr) deacylase [Candidatus Gastranaerophilales bacterium]|nr:D-tyrosyl-tRNA(Tyr) deacylase [Candidatus Gastranaerophilales bacterium]